MVTPQSVTVDTLRLYDFLPQFVRDNDEAGGYQFLAWLDGIVSEGSAEGSLTFNYSYDDGDIEKLLTPYTVTNVPVPAATGLQALDDIVRDTPYAPGYSALLDINRCPTYALPWLGQFVGVRLSPILNPLDAPAARQQILAENAFARGTLAAVAAAANAQMTPPFTVTVLERTSFISSTIAPDPYAVTISFASAGVGALTWGQLNASYASWGAVNSSFANWAALFGNTTGLESAVIAALPAGLFVYFDPF